MLVIYQMAEKIASASSVDDALLLQTQQIATFSEKGFPCLS